MELETLLASARSNPALAGFSTGEPESQPDRQRMLSALTYAMARQALESVERREREWLAFKERIPNGPTLLLRSERQPRRPTITVNIHIHQPPSHD